MSIICKIGSLRWGNRASASELQASVVLPEAVAGDAQTQHRYYSPGLAKLTKSNTLAREAFRGDFALPPKSCKPELRAYHNETGMDSATEYRDRYSHRN